MACESRNGREKCLVEAPSDSEDYRPLAYAAALGKTADDATGGQRGIRTAMEIPGFTRIL